MRPVRLALSGFTAFRQEVDVCFDGVELFALTGPTGSGKTSLIDAMCFALYGAVPRLDRNKVEPVISLGAQEARVHFTFTVGGREYVAARVVRRTRTGATTAEARLEGGPEPVSGADEVTAEVERLLGFGFDHFTRCVVLPQGEFAAFLHDPPRQRQELLARLLDLGLYERMREAATRRKSRAEGEAALLEGQVASLSDATEDAEAAAARRVTDLEELLVEVEEINPRLAGLREEVERVRAVDAQAESRLRLLATVAVPPGVAEVSARRMEADAALAAARAAVEEVEGAALAAEETLAALPPADVLTEVLRLHGEVAALEAAREKAAARVAQAEVEAEVAGRAAAEARDRLAAAVADLGEAEREHRAHLVARDLREGEPCPVCGRRVERIPERAEPPGLDAAAAAEQRARAAHDEARDRLTRADEGLVAARSRVEELLGQIAESRLALAERPSREEAEAAQATRKEAEAAARSAREAVVEARRRLDAARTARERVEAEGEEARRRFDAARDAVAALDPPAPRRSDLHEDWTQLAGWAAELRRQLDVERAAAGEALDRAVRSLEELDRRLTRALEEAGVDRGARTHRDACFEELTIARRHLERVREARERAAKLGEDADRLRGEARLAEAMARHLSARGFEAWILEEALVALVAGANQLLADLSGGAYSLQAVSRGFAVVDHRNADEVRSVQTLSGGETFLVSLALALSLAEQLTALSAGNAARLESIFLDEGFGTLDGETLDVVASVIQELGASGRTVGIVTHVKELAEQVPVRFEVRKGPAGASVTRVEA